MGTSRRSKTSLERGPTKSETAVAAVIVGSEGFFNFKLLDIQVPYLRSNEVPGLLGKTLVKDGEGDQLFCEIPGVSVEDFSGRTGDLLVDCFEGVGSLVEG